MFLFLEEEDSGYVEMEMVVGIMVTVWRSGNA